MSSAARELSFEKNGYLLKVSFYSDGVLKVSFHGKEDRDSPVVSCIRAAPSSVEASVQGSSISDGRLVAEIGGSGELSVGLRAGGVPLLRGAIHEGGSGLSLRGQAKGAGFYGLGQHQGLFNYVGNEVVLSQRNPTESAVPLLVSDEGYGIMWDNPSLSKVKITKGDHDFCDLEYWCEEGPLDYYVIYGGNADGVVSKYRELTGPAPLLPKWAYGYWQSKERYKSQGELLSVAAEFERRGIPLDVLVQDWQYWGKYGWNAMKFDEGFYPDPATAFKELHARGVRLVISVWSNFGLSTEIYKEFKEKGLLIPGTQNYDPFGEEGRKAYWEKLKRFADLGVDGWWLDASEPELNQVPSSPASDLGTWSFYTGLHESVTKAGKGSSVVNAFPLFHTQGVYEGSRQYTGKRVVILTRSAYLGQQRNSAITWSGDVYGDWSVLAGQIPAGLNFSCSGIPYWTTDTGGFLSGDPANAAYREVFIRWLQWSTFCPIMRVHGTWYAKEPWTFGEEGEKIIGDYIKLRHRLFPYVYSVARMVTEGYTMMRPLFMDFADKGPDVLDRRDQYMFGPYIMVNPVTAPTRSRRVYLPRGLWYDFWTGEAHDGGSTLLVDAPLDRIPLFVKAGSILPMMPANFPLTQPLRDIELRVYPGADGSFQLYDDDGETYEYEKGAYVKVPITWSDGKKALKIENYQGAGAAPKIRFKLVIVKKGKGVGIEEGTFDAQENYEGGSVEVNF